MPGVDSLRTEQKVPFEFIDVWMRYKISLMGEYLVLVYRDLKVTYLGVNQ